MMTVIRDLWTRGVSCTTLWFYWFINRIVIFCVIFLVRLIFIARIFGHYSYLYLIYRCD